jgi:hypothetical protein
MQKSVVIKTCDDFLQYIKQISPKTIDKNNATTLSSLLERALNDANLQLDNADLGKIFTELNDNFLPGKTLLKECEDQVITLFQSLLQKDLGTTNKKALINDYFLIVAIMHLGGVLLYIDAKIKKTKQLGSIIEGINFFTQQISEKILEKQKISYPELFKLNNICDIIESDTESDYTEKTNAAQKLRDFIHCTLMNKELGSHEYAQADDFLRKIGDDTDAYIEDQAIKSSSKENYIIAFGENNSPSNKPKTTAHFISCPKNTTPPNDLNGLLNNLNLHQSLKDRLTVNPDGKTFTFRNATPGGLKIINKVICEKLKPKKPPLTIFTKSTPSAPSKQDGTKSTLTVSSTSSAAGKPISPAETTASTTIFAKPLPKVTISNTMFEKFDYCKVTTKEEKLDALRTNTKNAIIAFNQQRSEKHLPELIYREIRNGNAFEITGQKTIFEELVRYIDNDYFTKRKIYQSTLTEQKGTSKEEEQAKKEIAALQQKNNVELSPNPPGPALKH